MKDKEYFPHGEKKEEIIKSNQQRQSSLTKRKTLPDNYSFKPESEQSEGPRSKYYSPEDNFAVSQDYKYEIGSSQNLDDSQKESGKKKGYTYEDTRNMQNNP